MVSINDFQTVEKVDRYSFGWRNHVEDLVFGAGSREINLLKRLLERHRVDSVLDVASGNGDPAIALAGMGKKVTTLDRDLSRVHKVHLKSILAGVRLVVACGDMRDLSSVYKQKCQMITCMHNSLSFFLKKTDIWGILAQMYLALEPWGGLVLQTFDYDRLYAQGASPLTEINEHYSDLGIKVIFEPDKGVKGARFIFELSDLPSPGRYPEKVIFPVWPIFRNELDMWLSELGFKKTENCEALEHYHLGGGFRHSITVAYRPGSVEN